MAAENSKAQIVKIIILSAILLLVLLFNGKIKKIIHAWRTPKTIKKTRHKVSFPEINRILSEKLNIPALEKSSDPNWPDDLKRDIFSFQKPKAVTKKKKPRTQLKLEATFTGGIPLAVINNQPLKIGQSILGYQVRKITDKQAVLTKNGHDIVLKIR